MNKEFIEALKAHLIDELGRVYEWPPTEAIKEIDAFAVSWKPEAAPQPQAVGDGVWDDTAAIQARIDTSPAALRALADDTSLTLEDYLKKSAQALCAVADEKEAQAVPVGYASPCMLRMLRAGKVSVINLVSIDEAVLDGPPGTGEFDVPLYAAPQAPEASPWQPIETAPKDRSVLLWWRTVDRPLQGRYVCDEHGEGWMNEGDRIIPRNQADCVLWHPLPEGPKT